MLFVWWLVHGINRFKSEDAFFAFHSINAYDDADGSVVLDIAVYKDNSVRTTCHCTELDSEACIT